MSQQFGVKYHIDLTLYKQEIIATRKSPQTQG